MQILILTVESRAYQKNESYGIGKELQTFVWFQVEFGKVSENTKNSSEQDLANAINKTFPELLEEYRLPQPLKKLSIDEDTPELSDVSEIPNSLSEIRMLTALNSSKAFFLCGVYFGPARTCTKKLCEWSIITVKDNKQ